MCTLQCNLCTYFSSKSKRINKQGEKTLSCLKWNHRNEYNSFDYRSVELKISTNQQSHLQAAVRLGCVSEAWLRRGQTTSTHFAPVGVGSWNEPLWSVLLLLLLLPTAALLQCPRSLTWSGAQSATVPVGQPDAHAGRWYTNRSHLSCGSNG